MRHASLSAQHHSASGEKHSSYLSRFGAQQRQQTKVLLILVYLTSSAMHASRSESACETYARGRLVAQPVAPQGVIRFI